MNKRQIGFILISLLVIFLTHYVGRFLQIGGAQLAPSLAIYVLLALLIAPSLDWGSLLMVALATGILTTVATSSPVAIANTPAHGLGFLLAAAWVKQVAPNNQRLDLGRILLIITAAMLVSWTLFTVITWFGLIFTPFTRGEWVRYGVNFGRGPLAWWLYGFVGVGIPSALVGFIVTPYLYYVLKPLVESLGWTGLDADSASVTIEQ